MKLTPRFRAAPRRALGLVVLANDETLERAARIHVPPDNDLFVSRVPSGATVTPDTLAAMERDLPAAAALFPKGRRLDAVGYACTSGAANIGPDRVAAILRDVTGCDRVTDPLTALIATCRTRGFARLGIVSPYTEDVCAPIRARLAEAGIAVPVFGSFDVSEESRVAQITPAAISDGAMRLVQGVPLDAIFLSCTNLDTEAARPVVRDATGVPCLCSNSVLLDHLLTLAEGETNGAS